MPTGLSSVPNSHGKKYSQLNLNSPLYLTGIFSILSAQAWGDGVTGSSEACLKYPLFSRIPEIFDANARFIGSHDHGDGRQCRVRPDACFLESNLRLPKVRQGSYSFRSASVGTATGLSRQPPVPIGVVQRSGGIDLGHASDRRHVQRLGRFERTTGSTRDPKPAIRSSATGRCRASCSNDGFHEVEESPARILCPRPV